MSAAATGTVVTETLLKARTGTFDLESIFSASLSGLKLTRIDAVINQCVEMWELDVSVNALTALNTLDGNALNKLKVLDVSGNALSSFTSLLPRSGTAYTVMETLYAASNQIQSFDGLTELSKAAPNLRTLFLMRIDGSASNPICEDPSYRERLKAAFPHLNVLDGERLKSIGAAIYTPAFSAQPSSSKHSADNTTTNNTVASSSSLNWSASVSADLSLDTPLDTTLQQSPSELALNASLIECRRLDGEAAALLDAISKRTPPNPSASAKTIVTTIFASANAASVLNLSGAAKTTTTATPTAMPPYAAPVSSK